MRSFAMWCVRIAPDLLWNMERYYSEIGDFMGYRNFRDVYHKLAIMLDSGWCYEYGERMLFVLSLTS